MRTTKKFLISGHIGDANWADIYSASALVNCKVDHAKDIAKDECKVNDKTVHETNVGL